MENRCGTCYEGRIEAPPGYRFPDEDGLIACPDCTKRCMGCREPLHTGAHGLLTCDTPTCPGNLIRLSIDEISLKPGDRILLTAQRPLPRRLWDRLLRRKPKTQNGIIYTVSTSGWERDEPATYCCASNGTDRLGYEILCTLAEFHEGLHEWSVR